MVQCSLHEVRFGLHEDGRGAGQDRKEREDRRIRRSFGDGEQIVVERREQGALQQIRQVLQNTVGISGRHTMYYLLRGAGLQYFKNTGSRERKMINNTTFSKFCRMKVTWPRE